jgi:hypothetical protein
MKTLIALFITGASFNSNASLIESIQGFYMQKVQTHVKTKKGVSTRTNINVAEVTMIDDNAARVVLNIQDKSGRCALVADFLKNGDTLVFTKNSETGRGTCEVTVANFRGRGLIVYENKDKGDCSDICSGKAQLGVRLFDRM